MWAITEQVCRPTSTPLEPQPAGALLPWCPGRLPSDQERLDMAATPVTYTYVGEVMHPDGAESIYTCPHCAALVTFGGQTSHSAFHQALYTALRGTLELAVGR